MDKRLVISAILYPIVQSVLLGSAVVLLVSVDGAELGRLLPYAVLMSLVMAAPIAWEIAPRLSLELSGQDRMSRFRAGRR